MDLRCIRSIVEDFGIGIANYIRDRILDPVLTLKPKGEGTGLGLSITYGMVKDHGGKLIVRKYACFIHALPCGSSCQ
jgi:signal transduction histidine kinase